MAKQLPERGAIPRGRRELRKLRRAVWLRMIDLGIHTQNELADRLELKAWTVSRTLLGRRESADVLIKLAAFAYGKKPDASGQKAA